MTFTFSDAKRKTGKWLAGLVLLLGASTATYAQYYPGSGYGYDPYDEERQHTRTEKHALKHHQQEERYVYGNGRALREHQRQERRQLKHEQRYERNTGDRIHGYYGNQGYNDHHDRGYRDQYEYDRYYPR